MKKPARVMAVGSLVLVLGCSTGPEGGSQYPERSLGWAYEIAEGVRDAEFPDGELIQIYGVHLDGEGLIEEQVLVQYEDPVWGFYFENDEDTTAFEVVVHPDGSTDSGEVDYSLFTIPVYYDASEWVHIADDTVMDQEGPDWDSTFRMLAVMREPYDEGDNVAWILYLYPDLQLAADVYLNADTNEVLHWNVY